MVDRAARAVDWFSKSRAHEETWGQGSAGDNNTRRITEAWVRAGVVVSEAAADVLPEADRSGINEIGKLLDCFVGVHGSGWKCSPK